MFLDECGFSLNLMRLYGWTMGGGRCCEPVPFNRGQNRSVLGAFSLPQLEPEPAPASCTSCNGMRALWQKLGAMKREDFEFFLREHLLPVLEPGSVLVLDNARIHHGGQIAQLVEQAGCSLLYLPPYSPDFSPIELAWSWIKNHVRALAPRQDDQRQQAIQDAAKALPTQAASAWFNHGGYGRNRKCNIGCDH